MDQSFTNQKWSLAHRFPKAACVHVIIFESPRATSQASVVLMNHPIEVDSSPGENASVVAEYRGPTSPHKSEAYKDSKAT